MFITPAYAQTATGAASGGFMGSPIAQFFPFILIFIIMYFLIIRPQQQQAKDQKAKIAGAQKGDTILTAGGIYGKVMRVEDDTVDVEIAKGVVVKVLKSTLADIQPINPKKAAND